MKSVISFMLILTAAIAFCLCTPTAGAADWPTWTGPQGRNVSAEKGLPEAFDTNGGKNVKWSTRLGTVLYGCPTVSDGKIFVGTNYAAVREDKRFSKPRGGVVACLDEASGRVLWQLVTPERKDGFPEGAWMGQQKWGICSSPTVDGDRVYLVTNGDDILCLDVGGLADGNDGPFQDEARFMAAAGDPPVELKPSDADILWRFDIPRELGVSPHDVASCSLLVHGDVVYASTSNGVGKDHPQGPIAPSAPAFIALDKRTGQLLAIDDERLSERLFHAQWSSPSMGRVGEKTLVFLGGGDGVCYAFEAISGRKPNKPGHLTSVWRYDCVPGDYRFRDGKPIPFYNGDVRVYKKKKKAKEDLTLHNASDGSYIGPSQIIATPIFHDNRIYIAIGQDPVHGLGRGMLHCIDATKKGDITKSGRIWSYDAIGRTICTIAVADGLVYAAELNGRLHCLDADTGKPYWIHDTGHETWAGPLIADGKIYLNTRHSFWTLAAGKEKRVLFTTRSGSECAPIAANGVLYVFMKGRLYALRQGASTPKM